MKPTENEYIFVKNRQSEGFWYGWGICGTLFFIGMGDWFWGLLLLALAVLSGYSYYSGRRRAYELLRLAGYSRNIDSLREEAKTNDKAQ